MRNLNKRFKKEEQSFDKISKERFRNNQIPDLRVKFVNNYFYNNIWRNSKFLCQEYGPVTEWIARSLKNYGVHTVIELGSGNGWLSLELAREGFHVTGLDISKESIKIAQNYLRHLKEQKQLSLRYVCKNIKDYREYGGESVVCFGFLHHLPPRFLKQTVQYLSKKMKPGQILLAFEPRYDHASYEMALLIYALRLALPNQFQYHAGIQKDSLAHIQEIFEELSEARKTQSEMDGESTSDLIVKTIKCYFPKVEIDYYGSFFDKIIGSIRVKQGDSMMLSGLLKQLDAMIVKYNSGFSRTVKIKAVKI